MRLKLIFAFLGLTLADPAQAYRHRPAILLHVGAVTSKNACSSLGITTCEQAVTEGTLGPHFVYLVVVRGDSMPNVAGFQCGIDYDDELPSGRNDGHGIDVFDWHLCADWQFTTGPPAPVWPEPLSGNLITWNTEGNCQTGALAVAGYFYLSAYDFGRFTIIPRPIDGLLRVADCQANEVILRDGADTGYVLFSQTGSTPGCNPCYVPCWYDPILPTTWSAIKALNR